MDIKWVLGIITSLNTAALIFILQDYLKFRFRIPEVYILKSDYQRDIDKLIIDNKEDHRVMIEKIDMLLAELPKKADRKNGG